MVRRSLYDHFDELNNKARRTKCTDQVSNFDLKVATSEFDHKIRLRKPNVHTPHHQPSERYDHNEAMYGPTQPGTSGRQ